MGVQTGDLLQVVMFQELLDQTVLNVFHYRFDASPAPITFWYDDFAQWFEGEIVDTVRQEQVIGLYHNRIEVSNLSNGVDLHVHPVGKFGALNRPLSGFAPSYVSLGFILRRSTRVTRNGYKRISGLAEEYISGNDYQWAGSPTNQAAFEAAFAAKFVQGAVTMASPVIVRRPISVPALTYDYSNVSSAAFTQLGTQNTRKRRKST